MLAGVASAMKMPQDVYVAGQNGEKVMVYNCKTQETKTIRGYLRNIGVDNAHNVYVLVCDDSSGWGNYYIYKNFSSTPFQSFKSPQPSYASDRGYEGYTSMAMTVKGGDVVVAGVYSKQFNDKGFESRMFGYVNKVRVYQTEFERKSLKREHFEGYKKINTSKKKWEKYEDENFCGNVFHNVKSLVFHVDAVDYSDGYIYTTGWGEREYTELWGKTYYMVRRCPRVWRNGVEVVQQYENRTGAAWNIAAFKVGGKEYIFTSGHQRSKACSWTGDKPFAESSAADYPGYFDEAVVYTGFTAQGPVFHRVLLTMEGDCVTTNTSYTDSSNKSYGGGVTSSPKGNQQTHDVLAVKDGYYMLRTSISGKFLIVHAAKGFVKDSSTNKYKIKEYKDLFNLPESFKVEVTNIAGRLCPPMLAVNE